MMQPKIIEQIALDMPRLLGGTENMMAYQAMARDRIIMMAFMNAPFLSAARLLRSLCSNTNRHTFTNLHFDLKKIIFERCHCAMTLICAYRCGGLGADERTSGSEVDRTPVRGTTVGIYNANLLIHIG